MIRDKYKVKVKSKEYLGDCLPGEGPAKLSGRG